MSRGSRLQHRALTLTLIAAVGSMLLPSSLARGDADHVTSSDLTSGEPGSGPPVAVEGPVAFSRTSSVRWSDVPAHFWGRRAIDYVAGTHQWMRDYRALDDGTFPFKPGRLETRRLFAKAAVLAFAPDAEVDPNITFDDLSSDSPFYRYANVAVQNRWMRRTIHGTSFSPELPVSTRAVHRALVLALGLREDAAGLDAIHTRDGRRFKTPSGFGTLLIGMRLGLRYNHSDESLDVGPDTPLSRAEVAWSLYRAKTLDDWQIEDMARYATIQLPNMRRKAFRFVQWGIDYVGYPYVWGGEWATASPANYRFGYQPVGGFDCSGLTWWNMKAAGDGWNNRPPRPYVGWPLPQRVSAEMATVGHVRYRHLVVGDLMFYDGDDDGRVDHVDTYVGNGWSLDSGGSNAGVTITYTGPGSWYQQHFVHGRTIMG
jgi:cell wall-associated NlpC family hydrolase